MKKRRWLSKAIQLLLLTTIMVSCLALAKYKNTVASSGTAVIANAHMQTTLDTIILQEMKPGDSKEYNFEVKNYTEDSGKDNISDVAMAYTIAIETGNYLPLTFELVNISEDGTNSNENLLTNNITNEITIGPEKTRAKYKLKVNWNENNKNYKYSDEIDYVKILINSYQVDPNK